MNEISAEIGKDDTKVVRRAQNLVKLPQADDGKVGPKELAGRAPDEFAYLHRVLSSKYAENIVKEYEKFDEEAGLRQNRFFFFERLKVLLFFVVGLLSLVPEKWLLSTPLSGKMALFQGGLICVALLGTAISVTQKYFERWRKARAVAEHARGRIFWYISSNSERYSDTEEIPPLLQVVEFIRRYRLQHQYAYFGQKIDKLREADREKRGYVYIISLVAFVILLPILFEIAYWLGLANVSSSFETAYRILLDWLEPGTGSVLGIVALAAAFEALISGYYRIDKDNSFIGHFRQTGKELEDLAEKLPDVREAAMAGNADAVREWVRSIEDVLVAEQQEWFAQHSASASPFKDPKELDPWPVVSNVDGGASDSASAENTST